MTTSAACPLLPVMVSASLLGAANRRPLNSLRIPQITITGTTTGQVNARQCWYETESLLDPSYRYLQIRLVSQLV